VSSEKCLIEEQSIEYCGWAVVSSDVVSGDLRWHQERSVKMAMYVMPKHVGATIHN
jgi:hypothetical protein